MTSFKIAVCLSGQLRTWRHTLPSLKRFFDDASAYPGWAAPHRVEVDYFCHTWDFNSWWRSDDDKYASEHERVPAADAEDFAAAYGAKASLIEPRRDPTHRRWDDMFYSFMRSVHLKRSYELQQGFEYDLVIKARYDICFERHLRFQTHELAPLTAYTSNPVMKFAREFYQSDFHDVLFWSDSLTMDLMGDASRTYVRNYPADAWAHPSRSRWGHFGPGVILHRHMSEIGLRPEINPSGDLVYSVYRERAAKENLDPLDTADYARIRDISLGKVT